MGKKLKKKKLNKEIKTPKVKQPFKVNLLAMMLSLSVIPLMISVIIVSVSSFDITKGIMKDSAVDKLSIVATNLASHCKENEINAINVTAYYDYLDSLKEEGIEMAILLEGSPCNTSIKNENDFRIREIILQRDVLAERDQLGEGYYEENVEIDGQVYFTYCMPIEVGGEITGIALAAELQENVTGQIAGIVSTFVIIAAVLIVIFAVVAFLFSRGFAKSFKVVEKNVNTLSQGDLTEQKKAKSIIKEMSAILSQTDALQQNMGQAIGKTKDVSQKLVDTVAETTALSNSSAARANQITCAMDDLATSTVSMAENVQDISLQMIEIGNCVNDISDNVDNLYKSSENMQNTNIETKSELDTILENSKKSVDAVKDIADQIKQTNDSIEEIDKAVQLILDLSEQTNLLSLNASIEAARAGVHGRGFAVVAEEIRHLSEQSAEGAEMIKALAGTITGKSQKSVELANGVRKIIIEEQTSIEKTQHKYEELSKEIGESVVEIKAIAEKAEHLTEYKEKVIGNVQDLSAISEETAASSQEVGANVTEIISEIDKVNDECEVMNNMAKELEDAVSYFQV
ncbi:MAG: hypothetical protein E7299_07665 [Lachnospiraceae bacterium]|nr:hypothetical protein [Lachnospiraceae bacterium]